MKKYTLVWIVIGVIVLVIIAYLAGQSSGNSTPPSNASLPALTTNNQPQSQVTSQKQSNKSNYSTQSNAVASTYLIGSESSCSQGAQDDANGMNHPPPQSSNIPASSYFVVSSHYVPSQNTCYFELHDQLPLPLGYGAIDDTYTLYVMSGQSEYQVTDPAEVAECSTPQNTNSAALNNSTTCQYYDPIETQNSSGFSYWITQYSSNNAPPMSQQDFQSLVQKDMIAN